jgi:hypothetical protein
VPVEDRAPDQRKPADLVQRASSLGHVVLDEAQDLSPMLSAVDDP